MQSLLEKRHCAMPAFVISVRHPFFLTRSANALFFCQQTGSWKRRLLSLPILLVHSPNPELVFEACLTAQGELGFWEYSCEKHWTCQLLSATQKKVFRCSKCRLQFIQPSDKNQHLKSDHSSVPLATGKRAFPRNPALHTVSYFSWFSVFERSRAHLDLW